MCVLICKPQGIPMPSDTILRRAFLANPDGCGFASTNHSFKGLSFKKFMKEIKKVTQDEACIIHMRLATHGSVCDANCHPFFGAGVAFAHNGILSYPNRDNMTDSETAFRDVIEPEIKKHGLLSDYVTDAVESVIGTSRFAFLKGKRILMFGNYEKIDGVYYSNTRGLGLSYPSFNF